MIRPLVNEYSSFPLAEDEGHGFNLTSSFFYYFIFLFLASRFLDLVRSYFNSHLPFPNPRRPAGEFSVLLSPSPTPPRLMGVRQRDSQPRSPGSFGVLESRREMEGDRGRRGRKEEGGGATRWRKVREGLEGVQGRLHESGARPAGQTRAPPGPPPGLLRTPFLPESSPTPCVVPASGRGHLPSDAASAGRRPEQ